MEMLSLLCHRTTLLASALGLAILLPKAHAESTTNSIENSVVKIFSTVRYPDPFQPWTKRSPSDITGSGVVIDGKHILSNAHVVLYASKIQVQANQGGDKIFATVEAVAPGIDLAVLKLDDGSFFDTHPPVQFSTNLPAIKDAVMAYGYPEGGNTLSITKGIVSRIEFAEYNAPVSGLRIQIDAAINPGNSGGPAVVGNRMIGLAFSALNNAQNIGYIIPCEEIQLFLQDIADGHYDGKPAMFDDYQTLENPALRSFLHASNDVKGVVVHIPFSADPGYPLKQWDIITQIGDTPIDDQGMIKLNDDLHVSYRYLVQKIAKNGKLPLTVVRAGKVLPVELPVSPAYPLVIPDLGGGYPSYFIYGPLVFTTATKQYVGGMYSSNEGGRYLAWLADMKSPLITRIKDKPAFDGEGLVIVASPYFPHKVSTGYSPVYGRAVKTVNGVPIKNLEHLVQVLRDSQDEYITFEFDCRFGETLVFSRKEITAATDEILTDNGIRSQGSEDVLAIWNAHTPKK
jgi:S1-C subfamily serine protease